MHIQPTTIEQLYESDRISSYLHFSTGSVECQMDGTQQLQNSTFKQNTSSY